MRLFHIVDRDVWAEATRTGEYGPGSLDTEGFVHFSFLDQVARTANARFRDVGNLCVVEIDPSAITDEVRVEDSYGSGEEFPHVYGAIPTAAALAVHPIVRDDHGDYLFRPNDVSRANDEVSPDERSVRADPGDPASTDR